MTPSILPRPHSLQRMQELQREFEASIAPIQAERIKLRHLFRPVLTISPDGMKTSMELPPELQKIDDGYTQLIEQQAEHYRQLAVHGVLRMKFRREEVGVSVDCYKFRSRK